MKMLVGVEKVVVGIQTHVVNFLDALIQSPITVVVKNLLTKKTHEMVK
jgi:hypothetical protein